MQPIRSYVGYESIAMNEPLTSDQLTLNLIATGLILLTQQVDQGQPIYPYPEPLQRGLDRLTVAAMRRNLRPPQGIPELLEWSHRPLNTWPLQFPQNQIDGEDTLLIDYHPSSTCDGWACISPDVEAEITEQHLIQQVFKVCSQNNNTQAYVAFRTLLIKQPALSALDLQKNLIQPDLIALSKIVQECYQAAPPGWAKEGIFICCAHCSNLLHPLANGKYLCENEQCHYRKGSLLGKQLAAQENPLWLNRGLRRFVAAPGLTELRLAERLRKLGIPVELWPALDRYDLRVTLPNKQVWAIDVKDWHNPFLLARKLDIIPTDPAWDKAFIVVPDYRLKQRSDYLRALETMTPKNARNFEFLSEKELVDQIKEQL